ncbi:urease accessory protein UreE [Stappia taiwanensis]|uniref:Urease accessory protein UreE n=1 Tax=Stappia taiwanensis TaxID=992267 RepID=A0A838XNL4_9HYPH|nr:urease accessory protein UreE [Stappia taiwanensis]MBA4612859.1 urease accessory protein UreE [Stappia taiwanensis]GGF07281.1 urease accessory protein UreE [Stappia taiwanensis]
MNRVAAILPAGSWEGAPADSILLDREDRHRRRAVLDCAGGTRVLLDLPQARHLHHGDGLQLEDGRIVAILAAAEDLVEIEAAGADALVRIAWHLGNRHLPVQLLPGALRIRRDHVIEDMVARLGGRMTTLAAPFDPEHGAYGEAGVHGHDGHSHGAPHHPPHVPQGTHDHQPDR